MSISSIGFSVRTVLPAVETSTQSDVARPFLEEILTKDDVCPPSAIPAVMVNMGVLLKDFVGREELLNALTLQVEVRELKIRISEAKKPCPLFFIHGLTGMGRTELSLMFADRFRFFFGFVGLIDAATPFSLYDSYTAIAPFFKISTRDKSLREIQREVYQQLEYEEKPWLLIFDHVKTYNDLNLTAKGGLAVILPEMELIVPHNSYTRAFNLSFFTDEEALKLFPKEIEASEQEKLELVQRLNHHPFFLHVAIRSLQQTQIPLKEYLVSIQPPPLSSNEKEGTAPYLTQDLVLKQALSLLSLPARQCLLGCMHFDPGYVDVSLVNRLLKKREDIEAVINQWEKLALAKFQRESQRVVFTRQLRWSLKRTALDKPEEGFLSAFSFIINEVLTSTNSEYKSSAFIHGYTLVWDELWWKYVDQKKEGKGALLLGCIATHFKTCKDLNTALVYAQMCHKKCIECYGDETPWVLWALNILGRCYLSLGESCKARKYDKKVEEYWNNTKECCEKIFTLVKKLPKEIAFQAEAEHNMGAVLFAQKDYEGALKFFGKALEWYRDRGQSGPFIEKIENQIRYCEAYLKLEVSSSFNFS